MGLERSRRRHESNLVARSRSASSFLKIFSPLIIIIMILFRFLFCSLAVGKTKARWCGGEKIHTHNKRERENLFYFFGWSFSPFVDRRRTCVNACASLLTRLPTTTFFHFGSLLHQPKSFFLTTSKRKMQVDDLSRQTMRGYQIILNILVLF